VAIGQEPVDESRSDEPGCAGDQGPHDQRSPIRLAGGGECWLSPPPAFQPGLKRKRGEMPTRLTRLPDTTAVAKNMQLASVSRLN
jgi:hypothetical protein